MPGIKTDTSKQVSPSYPASMLGHEKLINEVLPDSLEASKTEASIEFLDIVEREDLYPVFQPIIDINKNEILGFEALIRGPQNSYFESPHALFMQASKLKMENKFELLCRKITIKTYVGMTLAGKLFMNISPTVLLSPRFKQGQTIKYMEKYGLDPCQVVMEVTEHQKTSQYDSLKTALNYYRELGFEVALDDLGAGYSSLRLWNTVLPDFIKIDKHFIQDIHNEPIKQSFVRGLVEMSAGSNCQIIAEGVEKKDELIMLNALGLPLAQGYYFARPEKTPANELDASLFECINSELRFETRSPGQTSLEAMAKETNPITPKTLVKNVLELFQHDQALEHIPVVDNKKPVGLVERYRFLNQLMETMYGVDLYGKKAIEKFLKREPIIVDIDADLEFVSQSMTSINRNESAFIITRNGNYFGVATIIDLLESITEVQIQNARHANPLTLLPGIVPTNKIIDDMLAARNIFSVAYFDLDNFKPFNDFYGYDSGDRIIKLLAELLSDVYRESNGIIGHIGGDDFIVVDVSGRAEENCQRILDSFAAKVPAFYSQGHIDAGGIEGKDRLGNRSFFSLLSVSVGIVPDKSVLLCDSHIEISDLASAAKKMAKKAGGNSLFVNQRTSSNTLQCEL